MRRVTRQGARALLQDTWVRHAAEAVMLSAPVARVAEISELREFYP